MNSSLALHCSRFRSVPLRIPSDSRGNRQRSIRLEKSERRKTLEDSHSKGDPEPTCFGWMNHRSRAGNESHNQTIDSCPFEQDISRTLEESVIRRLAAVIGLNIADSISKSPKEFKQKVSPFKEPHLGSSSIDTHVPSPAVEPPLNGCGNCPAVLCRSVNHTRRQEIEVQHDASKSTTKLPISPYWHTPSDRKSPQSDISHRKRRSSLKQASSYGNPVSPTTSSRQQHLKRRVSFGKTQIRQYNVALSDHPSCSSGPPIQLSWEYREQESLPVEDYEETREKLYPRRQGEELLLSLYERHVLLVKQGGCTRREIKRIMKEVGRVKRERMITDLFLPAQGVDETVEEIVASVKAYFQKLPQLNPSRHGILY